MNIETRGIVLRVNDLEYSQVAGDVDVPPVKYGAIRVLATSGPVGVIRVEVQVQDIHGNVLTADNSTTFTVRLGEGNPNDSAACETAEELAGEAIIRRGKGVITLRNTEPEVVLVTPASTPYLEAIPGKVSFGGIGSRGIRIIHWEEEKD